MFRKKYKIKRYSNIYGPNTGNRRPIRIILIIAGLVLCSLLGWTLYLPTYNFFMGLGENESSDVAPVSQSEVQQSEIPNVSQEEVVNESSSSETIKDDTIRNGVFLPRGVLSDYEAFDDVLDSIKAQGFNSVIVDAKSAMGEILFLTENETSIKSLAISGTAFDASEIAKRIKEKGLKPIAKIHAFRDDMCAKANNDMAVKYYDTTFIWLDNSPENGGRGWLNPYNEKARKYICDISVELVKKGFEEIMVDSLQFPKGLGREKIGYGEIEGSKTQMLKLCMDEILSACEKEGGKAQFIFEVSGIEDDCDMLYGGDLKLFGSDNLVLTASLEQMDFLKNFIMDNKSERGACAVILQSYNNDGSQLIYEEMKKSMEELKSINIRDIYLYNPQGIYQF